MPNYAGISQKSMSNAVSPATVRTQFDRILKRVENNQERFSIDRRGDPRAVIMSIQDFIKTIAPGAGDYQGHPRRFQSQGH